MNLQFIVFTRRLALACIFPLCIAACGGDDGASAPQAGAASRTPTRSGKVYLQAGVSNALVCLDLQGDQQCHADSPTATTGADGSYQLHYQPRDAADARAFASSPVLAQITGSQGTYILSAPAEKSEQINPLTTLVQRHMARSGASLEAAEHAVAQQLGIDTAHIYDYEIHSRFVPSFTAAFRDLHHQPGDNARTAALLTSYGLERGVDPMTHASQEPVNEADQLMAFHFKDATHYEYDLHKAGQAYSTAGQMLWSPTYGGKKGGNDRTLNDMSYAPIAIKTSIYTGHEEFLRTRGNPARVEIHPKNNITPILPTKYQAPISRNRRLPLSKC